MLIDLNAEFQAMITRLFEHISKNLDSWQMTEKDWASCEPKESEEYKRGHTAGINSVKDMLPMLLDEHWWAS